MSYATLKMLGYSTSGIEDSPDWTTQHRLGIRIRQGANPSPALFHPGQPAVIYDSRRRTAPAHGEFTSNVFPLDPPEHGCELGVAFQAHVALRSTEAPKLHDHLPGFDTQQKSYRKLTRDEYETLVGAIDATPGARRFRG
jgi:hypothetical protein